MVLSDNLCDQKLQNWEYLHNTEDSTEKHIVSMSEDVSNNHLTKSFTIRLLQLNNLMQYITPTNYS